MTVPTQSPPSTLAPSRATLPILLAAQFIIPMSIAGTAIALPAISQSLGSQPTGLQWVVNGFNVAFAAFTLVWGAVSDRIGYRRSFRLGVAVALLGTAGSAAATSLGLLDMARVVAGIGAAAVLTGASAIISNAYTGSARTKAFAAFGTVNGLGLAVGPTVAGVLIGLVGWRGVFATQAVVLLIALIFSRALPAIAHQAHAGRKLLDLSLLANPRFLAMVLVPVAGAIGFVTVLTYLPNALSAIAGLSPTQAGALMLAATLPVLAAPAAVAKLLVAHPTLGSMHIIYVSLVALVLGDLGLLLLRPDAPLWLIVAPMALTGLGFGLPIGLIDAEALAAVPANRAGTAAGVLNFFRIGSEAVFVAAYSATLSWLIHAGLPGAADAADRTAAGSPGHAAVYANSLAPVLVGMAILVAIITVAVIMLHRRRSANASRDLTDVQATNRSDRAA